MHVRPNRPRSNNVNPHSRAAGVPRKSRRGKVTTNRRVLLDTFTERDLEFWSERSEDAQRYSDRVYFDLERHRAANHDALCDALRSAGSVDVDLENWARVCDYRWSLTPLSPVGSLKGIGGRFNIGEDLDRARGQHFQALYIAADVDTAFLEFFGGEPDAHVGEMKLQEYALRRKTSFTTFTLRGRAENVLDLRSPATIKAFAKIISTFELTGDTRRFARKIGVPVRSLLRTAKEIHKRILMAPKEWRTEPQLFGIPASNQIFSRYVRDAGFEGVIYPSQQGGDTCLAIYPDNLAGTRIEVVGGAPPQATHLVMDKDYRFVS
jgi:hypothetical protein